MVIGSSVVVVSVVVVSVVVEGFQVVCESIVPSCHLLNPTRLFPHRRRHPMALEEAPPPLAVSLIWRLGAGAGGRQALSQLLWELESKFN